MKIEFDFVSDETTIIAMILFDSADIVVAALFLDLVDMSFSFRHSCYCRQCFKIQLLSQHF